MKSHRFYMPTEVLSGPGVVNVLAGSLHVGTRPALLCGSNAMQRFGYLDRVRALLPGALVLEGCPENPTFTDCEAYVSACREGRVDAIVALGGGSVMDAAKVLALLIPNKGSCGDYVATVAPAKALPIVAIPTTAGTGSEVTPYAVLVDPTTNSKVTLRGPDLFPQLALLDPELTVTLPPDVTKATALDALSQAMEGTLSLKATPLGDTLVLTVCRDIVTWLPKALETPYDLEAREHLLRAAMLSGMVIAQSGTTLVHGMGYSYTLEYGIAHGAANALLLPPLFWRNAHHEPLKVALLSDALGRPCPAKPEFAKDAICQALYEFYHKIHFSYSAHDHGVPAVALPAMAARIIQEPHRFKNQVGTFTEQQVLEMYQASWSGSVDGLTFSTDP